MAINQDIINPNTNWENQTKGYVEDGLKALLRAMLDVLENPTVASNSVGREQLTQAIRDAIDSIAGKVPNTLTVNNKALSQNITLNSSDVGAMPADAPVVKGVAVGENNPVTPDSNGIVTLPDGGAQVTIDPAMSGTSENPVQNKVIKAYVDAAIQEAVEDIPAGQDGITPYIGSNGHWWLGDETDSENDTGVTAQGPAGEDGTLTLEEGETPTLEIVPNLDTDDDLTDNIKVLSAGMGKKIGDNALAIGQPIKTGTTTTETEKTISEIAGIDSSGNAASSSAIVDGQHTAQGSYTFNKIHLNGNQKTRCTSNNVYDISDFDESVTVVIPSGWLTMVRQCPNLTTTNSSDLHDGTTAAGDENGRVVCTIDQNYQYMCFWFRKSDNSAITPQELATLNSTFRVIETQQSTVGNTPAIRIVDEAGDVEKNIYGYLDDDTIDVYSKEAVDEKCSSAAEGYTNKVLSGTKTEDVNYGISHYNSSFVRGQRSVQSDRNFSMIKDGGSTAIRITTSTVLNVEDFGTSIKVFIPAGFYMAVRQAKNLTTRDSSDFLEGSNVYGGSEGTVATFALDQDYPYWAFWAKYGSSNAVITDQMITDLTEGFYFIVTETKDLSIPAIEIIGLDGVEKKIYNGAGVGKTQLYSKEKIDSLLGGSSAAVKIRVCQYNVGHWSMGTSDVSNISSSNYAQKLAAWKRMVNNVGADIMTLPEWAVNFGNNGSGAVAAADCGIFDDYQLSVGKSAASGWWINTIASKFAMSNAGDYDLGSTVSHKAYARYATVSFGGVTVKIVCTHLNWAQDASHVASRELEIKNLIKWLDNEQYVILGGDFNTDGAYVESGKTEEQYMAGVNEFDLFLNGFSEESNGVTTKYTGGFALANHWMWGDIKTYLANGSRPDLTERSQRPYCCLDNIITKGFMMTGVGVINNGYLSDHCGIMCDLTLI